MLKLLTGPGTGQSKGDKFPAVITKPPLPAVNKTGTMFVGPAERAVTVMLASFNAGPAQTNEDVEARIEGMAIVCAQYPNEVVTTACRSMLTDNPNNPFPPTCQDVQARCRKLHSQWKLAAWSWLHGYQEIDPWEMQRCSIELLDFYVMEFITAGQCRYQSEHKRDGGAPSEWWETVTDLRWFSEGGTYVEDEYFPRWERFLRAAGTLAEVTTAREKAKADAEKRRMEREAELDAERERRERERQDRLRQKAERDAEVAQQLAKLKAECAAMMPAQQAEASASCPF